VNGAWRLACLQVSSRAHPRFVRNPIYVSVLLVVMGEAILFRSLLLVGYALLLWAVFHAFVVFVEEPQLACRFGTSYEAYVHTVPRWLHRFPQG
jgi:protein-S-isoprenylcysteine O-methyltransferase Ste14